MKRWYTPEVARRHPHHRQRWLYFVLFLVVACLVALATMEVLSSLSL